MKLTKIVKLTTIYELLLLRLRKIFNFYQNRDKVKLNN